MLHAFPHFSFPRFPFLDLGQPDMGSCNLDSGQGLIDSSLQSRSGSTGLTIHTGVYL